MTIRTYLNELSLKGQYREHLDDVLKNVCNLLDITYKCQDSDNCVFKQGLLNAVVDENGTKFSELDTLVKRKKISRDTLSRLRDVIQKCKLIKVQKTKDSYKYANIDYNGSSIALACDDAIVNDGDTIIIASFPMGDYDVARISVSKNDGPPTYMPNVTSASGYREYLSNLGLFMEYDRTSKQAPTDEQSILVRNLDFEYTGKRETYTKAKRKVYCQKSTGDFWYIDGTHKNGGAHYEIFSPDSHFKGSLSFFEEDLTKIRKPKNDNEKNRTLHMK